MNSLAQRAAEAFEGALARAPEESAARFRHSRRLLGRGDAFDRVTSTQLLLETVERHLETTPLPRDPAILFFDFAGGGDGAKAAQALIGLIGARKLGGSFVHVAAHTPARGLGALVRTSLVDAGAGAGVLVELVANNRALADADIGDAALADIAGACALVVSFAPGGAAALFGPKDERLLRRSQVCVLTTPDPESLVADLPQFAAAAREGAGVDGVEFRFEVETEEGGPIGLVELGRCALGSPADDARERLWQLVDNAKRRLYRAVVTPTHGGTPAGAPIVCPCRRMLERGGHAGVSTTRIVPSGNRLVAAGRGLGTLS